MTMPATKDVLFIDGPLHDTTRTFPVEEHRFVVHSPGFDKIGVLATSFVTVREFTYEFHRVTIGTWPAYRIATVAIPAGGMPFSHISHKSRIASRRAIERHLYRQPIEWPEPSILEHFDYWWAWVCWRRGICDDTGVKYRVLQQVRDPNEIAFRSRLDFSPVTMEPRALIRSTVA